MSVQKNFNCIVELKKNYTLHLNNLQKKFKNIDKFLVVE